jgi:hypothetical protein
VDVISIISIGSFALVLHLSAKSVAPSSKLQIAARAPAEPSVSAPPVTPAPPPPVVAAEAEPAAQDQQPVKVQEATPARTEAASVVSEPIAPVTEPISQSAVPILPAGMVPAAAVTLASATESAPPAAPPVVGAPLDLSLNDPRSLRAHGIVAYRNGDLNGALADFNQAIQRDPTFAEAYIDRGIVLYRMRKFERAFADLAQAKKLDHASKTHTGPTPSAMVPPGGVPATTPKRPRLFGQAGLAFGMMRRPTGVE